MPAGAGARQFVTGREVAIRGEAVGEGSPIVLCHGITATRQSVVHGSRRLERAGHAVINYDARGHGESDPAPAGSGYGYPELTADLGAVIDNQVGGGRVVLAGHSMGAHTAVGFALEDPERVAGLVLIGPTYQGRIEAESLRYWDGLSSALDEGGIDGFASFIERFQGIDPRWRESVLRFTRERLERHRHLEAVVVALREVPRSSPFESMVELEALAVPTLVVASHDAADPGHPYAVAQEYERRIPGARMVSEPEGQSPLAWQGGRLSREVEAFCAEPEVRERLRVGS
jgi:pimeloyl-ACP methyl ester carboxylesterase